MEKLIEVVRNNPILYDTSHQDYIRTKLKEDLWEKIAKELNYTNDENHHSFHTNIIDDYICTLDLSAGGTFLDHSNFV
ncbi:hypothetical protein ABEB36_014268 [Hypothenemus hampei]|uniref:MADF domain-containing protein n=1 Tax=Hypothenemus hampei TaxID=57062 RepID=A0ABD1E4U3_HYPHA